MALGAAARVVDNDTDLDAANLNELDDGCNVYHSPNGGLNFRVTAGSVRLKDRFFAFAEVVADQAATVSVTTFVFLDQAGALQTNITGFPVEAHIPLAEVASSGSAITGITDRRARLVLPGSVDERTWRTGRFYTNREEAPSTVITLAADTLFGLPFHIHEDTPIDRIAVEVTTADGGATIRLGLYAESLTVRGEPGVLLEDLGTISAATTGMKTLTVSPTRRLPPGRCFVALISSSVVVEFRAHLALLAANMGWPGGTSDLLAASLDAAWRGSLAGNDEAASLPDPFPSTPTADLTISPAPAMRAG